MEKYYIDKDTKLKYKFLQDKLVKTYEEVYKKQCQEKKITKKQFNEMLCAHPRMHLGVEAIRKHVSKVKTPKCIDDICAYGEVLANDIRAFLVISETEDELISEIKDAMDYRDYPEICVAATKANLLKIFDEYSASDSFTRVENKEDVLVYYRKKVDIVEAVVFRIWGRPKLKEALLKIIKDLKNFICSSERPGIPSMWFEINPNLRFYAAGFELLEKEPRMYKKIKDGDHTWQLDYYPEIKELKEKRTYFKEQEKYFKKKREESEEKNYHYDEIDFFEKEIRDTIDRYFETVVRESLERNV